VRDLPEFRREIRNVRPSSRTPKGLSSTATNVIERAFREVRRRIQPMSGFSNTESCDRIVFGAVSHVNRSRERKPLAEFTQTASRYFHNGLLDRSAFPAPLLPT
jgi:transposase-like protein